MADIKQAIKYAQENPDSPFATELRKRIESGTMDKELISAGLKDKPAGAIQQFGTGLVKGVLSTAKSLGTMGEKLLQQTVGRGVEAITGVPKEKLGSDLYKPNTELGARTEQFVTPQTTAENAGFATEKIAEFFIPAGKIQKAQTAIDTMLMGTKLPKVVKATGKIIGKAGVEATGAGAVSLAQTGDIKEAGKSALFAGALKTGTGVVGETMKGLKFPEKLYSNVFRNTADDAIKSLETEVKAGLKNTNPAKYKEYVAAKIIDPITGKVNKTLAKDALDRGLKGSVTNMTKQTIANTWDLESAAQKTAKNKIIKIPNKEVKGLSKTLLDTAEDWDGVAGNVVSDKALNFAKSIETGTLTGTESLALKRFLDGLRIKSSFNPSAKRSLGQENYKFYSDIMRTEVRKLPGMSKIMDDYSFNIEALESLGKAASKQSNQNVINSIDSLFLGAGVLANEPLAGGLIAGARKILGTTGATTRLGGAIEKSGVSTKAGIVGRQVLGNEF